MQWRKGLKKAEGKEKLNAKPKSSTKTERARERVSQLCKSVRKFFFYSARLLQLCGCVGETKFQTFQFFYRVQVSPRYIEMKLKFFFSLLFVEVIVKITMCSF